VLLDVQRRSEFLDGGEPLRDCGLYQRSLLDVVEAVERCSQLGVLPKLLGDLGCEPAHPIVDGATVMVSIAPFG